MKTAEEKAINWYETTNHDGVISGGVISSDDYIAVINSVKKLLKEQDRDTRHACAEAVLQCCPHQGGSSLIWRDDAHEACMNVKAV